MRFIQKAPIKYHSTYHNFLRLITSDEDNIRQVDSDNLGGNLDRRVVCASFGCHPSYNSLDLDSRLMVRGVCILENKELYNKQQERERFRLTHFGHEILNIGLFFVLSLTRCNQSFS